MFVIISEEEFEDCWGGITHIGDVLETVMIEDEDELRRYVLDNYGPTSQDIKVRCKKVVI